VAIHRHAVTLDESYRFGRDQVIRASREGWYSRRMTVSSFDSPYIGLCLLIGRGQSRGVRYEKVVRVVLGERDGQFSVYTPAGLLN
jgi:hypothetical protein